MELHRKRFRELTLDELYELLRIRTEVFVVEQVGFRQSSDPFILDGIPHIRMTYQE